MIKTKTLLFLIPVILFLSGSAFGQIEITPKKVIYIRAGEDVPDFKKRFEVTYPMITGIKNARVLRRMEHTLDYWSVFETSLEENRSEDHWLTSMDYCIKYNKNSLLEMELIMEGSGAYPDGTIKTLVVNGRTGRRVRVPDVFQNIGDLLVLIDKAQKKDEAEAVAELKREQPGNVETLLEMLADSRYSLDKLDEFSISREGVTFLFDYDFPHVIQALEPAGRYFFTWLEIAPHVKKKGALGAFIK